MPPLPSIFQIPLTPSRVVSLLDAKVLSPAARDKLVDLCEEHAPWRAPDMARWRRFFDLHLLAIGVALWGLAAVFFFAANWSAMAGWMRLGLVCAGVVASAAMALRLGLERAAGKAALTLSGLLVGPSLAVYGQIYQTGADSYELFVGWALLLIPFTFLVRWSALVLFHLALFELAWVLFSSQVLGINFFIEPVGWGCLALFNGLAFVVTEWSRQRGYGHRTLPRIFLSATVLLVSPHAADALRALCVLTVPSRLSRVGQLAELHPEYIAALGCLGFIAAVASYSKQRDAFVMALVGAASALCTLPAVLVLLGAVFYEGAERLHTVKQSIVEPLAGLWVMFALFVVGVVVRRLHQSSNLAQASGDEGVLS